MERAYLLLELAQGADRENLKNAVGHGLPNSLALATFLVPGELIVHIESNDMSSLTESITMIAQLEGVTRTTVVVISRT
jgi:nitrate reductase NapAB chaperone NapD